MKSAKKASVADRARAALQDEFLRNAVKYTTERLRDGKQLAASEQGNWEEWRERGRQIRLHTIAHLDYYLNQFIDNARANGAQIHFAYTAEEAAAITLAIAEKRGARTVVKSKSMVSEEVHINEALKAQGIESIETDLGEYIIQLAKEGPSHIIIPAIHKNRTQIAELLSKEAGESLPPDTAVLAGFVRRKLREKFLEADIGMTGVNFAIAESGSIVLFENEGNARMVSTVPKTQISLMGMERIIPTWADLEVMATLLPRSATGQKLTVYMSGISGPRRALDSDGPEEMHIIIVDNGRSLQLGDPDFQELLNCIRCGACLNACPVYRHIGGHAYGGPYSGPIGAVLKPALQKKRGGVGRHRLRLQPVRRLLRSVPGQNSAARHARLLAQAQGRSRQYRPRRSMGHERLSLHHVRPQTAAASPYAGQARAKAGAARLCHQSEARTLARLEQVSAHACDPCAVFSRKVACPGARARRRTQGTKPATTSPAGRRAAQTRKESRRP